MVSSFITCIKYSNTLFTSRICFSHHKRTKYDLESGKALLELADPDFFLASGTSGFSPNFVVRMFVLLKAPM